MNIGSKIRQIRKEIGLTQAELANKLGIDRQKVANAERNTNKSAQQLIKSELIKNYNYTDAHFDPDSDVNKDVKDKLIEQMEIRLAEQAKIQELETKVDAMRGAIEMLLERLEKEE